MPVGPKGTHTRAHFTLHLRIFQFRKENEQIMHCIDIFGGCCMALRYTSELQVDSVCLFYFPLFTRCQNGTSGGALMRRNANDICSLITTTTINIFICFCCRARQLLALGNCFSVYFRV